MFSIKRPFLRALFFGRGGSNIGYSRQIKPEFQAIRGVAGAAGLVMEVKNGLDDGQAQAKAVVVCFAGLIPLIEADEDIF